MIVHQVLSGAGPVDAVTTQALRYRERFTGWGWGGSDHAADIDPRMDGRIRRLRELRPERPDVLLFHYSAYAPRLRPLLALPNRKMLVSHSVTPARWLWDWQPTVAVQCAIGHRQLPEFAAAADLAAGVSSHNTAELQRAGAQRTAVLPILVDRVTLGEPGPARPPGPPTVLFVGRLAPHKRQDEVVRAFALYRTEHAPAARLVLVGEALSPAFGRALRELADRVAPGAVTIESGLSAAALARRYREAHAFVGLSEHEGFCVPLLEAFHFGVPVIARPAGAVPEVAGDAALLVEDRDLAVVAELIHLAVSDDDLRTQLATRGRRRLQAFDPEIVAGALRAAVESVAA